jgi:hypothetical protein
MRAPRTRQGGQSMTDYAVILVFMMSAIGAMFIGNPSIVDRVVDGVRGFYANYSYPTSLP